MKEGERLISADGLKKILETKADMLRIGCPDNQYGVFLQKVSQMIDLVPTAEPKKIFCASINFNKEDLQSICDKAVERIKEDIMYEKLTKDGYFCKNNILDSEENDSAPLWQHGSAPQGKD